MPRIELVDVRKRFGVTRALAGAHLAVEASSIHALLGENGAGKSTLVRALYGLVRPDSGEIRIDGRTLEVRGPREALGLGIGLVPQHFMGVPALSVAENLALGEPGPPVRSPRSLADRARHKLERFGLELDPQTPAGALSVGEQQRLDIVRALSWGVRVLILDEPTAVLAPSEVSTLLALLERLRGEGTSIIFISHKLDEITALCDRVTVLRHGRTVATRPVAGSDAATLGRLMVGDAPPPPGRPPQTAPGDVVLRLRDLRAPRLEPLQLELHAGEILALAGIDGNGQVPLEAVLAGALRPQGGSLEVLKPPLAVLSGDRQRTGLVLDLSLEENLVLAAAAGGHDPPVLVHGWLRRGALRREARATLREHAIRGHSETPVGRLSGGNQQKVAVARALRGQPGVLVAVNPTRGLDVAATAQTRERLRAQARRAAGVLLISTDLDEVLELATRCGVLHRGRLLEVEPDRHTRERIGELMLGGAAA
ncbi:MAG: ABC transporter ATP-binding protein [Myxococcota bacterium]